MTAAELIGRAVAAARPFCWSNTAVDLSPTICAALEADGIRDDQHGTWWLDVGGCPIQCRMSIHLEGTEIVVHCQALDIWQGDLCQSAHERLAVEMKVTHFVNA